MFFFFQCLFLILICCGTANAGPTWYGKVVDYRTETPIADASVCAGIRGRVDLSCTTSASDGSFTVSYPDGASYDYYYLYVDSPSGNQYYNQMRRRLSPGDVTAKLVPNLVHIKGKIISAETGQALSGVGVALFFPGRIWESVESDSGGLFSFEPVTAYTNSRRQYNTYGVPEEDLPPDPDGNLIYYPWGVQAPYGTGSNDYAKVSPQSTDDDKLDPALSLTSSISDAIYTWVELRLPDADTMVDDNGQYITSRVIDDACDLAPDKIGLVLPAGTTTDTTPKFTWTENGCATWYKIYLKNTVTNDKFVQWYEVEDNVSNIPEATCSGGECFINLDSALDVGSYEWFIRGWNSYGNGDWSDVMNFNVQGNSTQPSKISHTSPSGTIEDGTPTCTWVKDPVSTWYKFWVGHQNGDKVFARWYDASEICSGVNCSVSIETELPDGNYQWYVKSWNDFGKVWSDGMSFTISKSGCESGEVYDCAGTCVDQSIAQSWIGDGFCDDGRYGADLRCEAFNNDDGDCN